MVRGRNKKKSHISVHLSAALRFSFRLVRRVSIPEQKAGGPPARQRSVVSLTEKPCLPLNVELSSYRTAARSAFPAHAFVAIGSNLKLVSKF